MSPLPVQLADQRCFNHAGREAAARCPACGRYFCRECVTDHEGKVLCAPCLARLSSSRASRSMPVLVRLTMAALGLTVGYLVIYLMGQLLMLLPDSFHEGTIWGGP